MFVLPLYGSKVGVCVTFIWEYGGCLCYLYMGVRWVFVLPLYGSKVGVCVTFIWG